MASLNIVYNPHCGKSVSGYMPLFNAAQADISQGFHKTFDGYAPTPLACFKSTAEHLGAGEIFVKDESFRFGLNAFKALGGSFCLGRYMADLLGEDISGLTYSQLISDKTKAAVGEITFVTATAEALHGLPQSLARKLLCICQRAVQRKGWKTSASLAQFPI